MRISDWSSDVCSSDLGLSIATYLVTHLCGGSASEATRAGSPPAAAKTVTYDPAQCLALAGVDVGDSEQKRILESLGFAVEGHEATFEYQGGLPGPTPAKWHMTLPSCPHRKSVG